MSVMQKLSVENRYFKLSDFQRIFFALNYSMKIYDFRKLMDYDIMISNMEERMKERMKETMRRDDREVRNIEEIQEILDVCKVCRLGMADGDRIYIVPMNFGYEFEKDGLTLYFHGAREGRKLELIRKNSMVGIEMDCGHELIEGNVPCQYSYYYGSVIGDGKAEIVEDPQEKLKALAVIMKHQTGKDFPDFAANPKLEKTVAVIRVRVGSYTCKCHGKEQI